VGVLMTFSKNAIQKLANVLKDQAFSEDNTVVQKMCFKKDSADLVVELGELGLQDIEAFEFHIEASPISQINIATTSLKSSVTKEILATENEVLETLQNAASVASEEQKVKILSNLNENNSLIKAINNNVQSGAIPMIFAVFSRRNDGYGIGSMGA
jgi:hypothetical protein